jgi:predicted ATPase
LSRFAKNVDLQILIGSIFGSPREGRGDGDKGTLFDGAYRRDIAQSVDGMISSQYVRSIALRRDKVESFDRYPFCLPAIKALQQIELHAKVTFFVGENGSGKSTFLEAIAVSLGFNAEGGSKNFRFGTRRSHSVLNEYLRIAKGVKRPRDGYFLRAESFFNVATEIERLDEGPGGPPVIDSYGGRSLHEQSHGESFLALMLERFGGHGIYILDEPEAALSPQRQLAVLSRIHDLVLGDSQFIIATHSPILMAYPDACIYKCDQKGLSKVAYQDTEHFKVTREFLANPERMLRIIMERGCD